MRDLVHLLVERYGWQSAIGGRMFGSIMAL